MSTLRRAIDAIRALATARPDDVELRQGLSPRDAASLLHPAIPNCPVSLVELLSFSNGGRIGTVEFSSADQLHLWGDALVPIHDWGCGDFDCIDVSTGPDHGAVVFANHNPGTTVRVADSLGEWLEAVIAEWTEHNEVLHAGDYRWNKGRSGVYSHVLDRLRGVNCELNR